MISSETVARLEFDKIRAEISRHAHSPCSVARIDTIGPLDDPGQIGTISGRIAEIRTLERSGIGLALGSFEDIRPSLEQLRPQGAILPPLDLLLFIPVLRLYAALGRQCGYREDIPLLNSIVPRLRGFPDILEPLAASIDVDGSIMDSASVLLKDIRRAKRGLAGRIEHPGGAQHGGETLRSPDAGRIAVPGRTVAGLRPHQERRRVDPGGRRHAGTGHQPC